MKTILPLKHEKLRAKLSPEKIAYQSSDDIPLSSNRSQCQPRVSEALELALHIKASGYNIYLAGEPDLGRSYMLKEYLAPKAKKESTPKDLVYVNNFVNPDAPFLLTLPAGQGNKLKKQLGITISEIYREVSFLIDQSSFMNKRSKLVSRFQKQRDSLFKQMNKLAGVEGFNFSMDESGGMTLYPVKNGKRLNEQELENMEDDQRDSIRKKSESLLQPLSGLMKKLSQAEQVFYENERSLEQDTVKNVVAKFFDPFAKKFFSTCESKELEEYCTLIRNDIIENHTLFFHADSPSSGASGVTSYTNATSDVSLPPEVISRYTINVFVDNSESSGAPIVFDDHPTLANLMGVMEREAEMGALITDFSLLRAGSIHRANGGYLILRAEEVFRQSGAWDALIRSLRSGLSRIEDSSEEDAAKAKSLKPQPVPLDLKVILVGSEEFYDILLATEEHFSKLFKIKAHMTEYTPRNSAGIRTYLSRIKSIIDSEKLFPFSREALAGVVDYGSRLIEDQNKLSLKFPLIREIMVEASAFASLAGKKEVSNEQFSKALASKIFRNNLLEEAFLEEYTRKIIKVQTRGLAVGKVNGLAVSTYGDFEFGLPHLISCTVGAGNGGVIDLERDSQLSGPIHSKAMMILKTYLLGSFAHNKPLNFTGSLGFEQNYFGIEGDSASGAELVALLSALAKVPVDLSYAFTGAVSQYGEIMAVGSVTRKIEGYFEVCKRHGLTGSQGVIIPRDNISHLMLNDAVCEAVGQNMFSIFAVSHITEAMELLTGISTGSLRADGSYTPGSLYRMVDKRLKEFSAISTKYRNRC